MALHRDRFDQVRAVDLPLMQDPALRQGMEAPVSRGFFFCVAFVGLGTFVAGLFWFGLPGSFVLDDWGNIEALVGIDGRVGSLWEASFGNPSGMLRRPLANLTLALNLSMTGVDVGAFKATNILLHLCAAAAIGALAWPLLPHFAPGLTESQRRWTTLLAATLWAIHPMQVSTVLYVVQRMAILSALFSCLALAAILHNQHQQERLPISRIAAFFLFGALALASKETGALVPALGVAIMLAAPTAIPARATRVLCLLLPCLAGGFAILLLWGRLTEGYAGRDFSLGDRMITQPFVLAEYVRNIVAPLPSHLGLFRDDITTRHVTDPLAWALAITAAILVIGSVALRRHFPLAAFAVAWFVACHLMESSFIPLEMAFEHRNYLAIFGPTFAFAASIPGIISKASGALKHIAHLLWLSPALLLAMLTAQRADQWSTEAELAAVEVANRPDSLRANNLAAIMERRNGDTLGPAIRMRRMQQLYPNQFFPWAAEMDIACDNASPSRIPWSEIERNAVKAPDSDEVLGYFNHITIKMAAGECQGIEPSELDRRMAGIASAMARQGGAVGAQYLTVLRASLLQRDDAQRARALFQSALDLGESPDMLLRAAQFEVTFGEPSLARAHLARIQALDPTDQRWKALVPLLEDRPAQQAPMQ